MESLIQDLHFAIRGLLRRPVFLLVAVISLALGIGANSAIFSLVNGILLRPLPGLVQPDRLVRIYTRTLSVNYPQSASYADYLDYRQADDVLEDIAAHTLTGFAVRQDGGSPELVWGFLTSGNYFDILGVVPSAGRFYGPVDEQEGAPAVVVSHAFWQERLGGRSDVAGEVLELDGQSYTIVGVAPPGFQGTQVLFSPDVWMPIRSARAVQESPELLDDRSQRVFWVTGRLRDGKSAVDADIRLSHVGEQLADAYTGDGERFEVHVMPESEARVEAGLGGAMRLMATILLVLVGLVLLIACGNVANLLLARASSRRREIGLRLAIGAGARQLVQQLLVESLLLALAGGVAGIGVAFAASRWIDGWDLPTAFPIRFETTPDARVLLFTLLISLAAGIVFGLAPALRAARTDLVSTLRGTAGPESVRGRILGSSLVVVQMALSLVLLVGAALFLRSMQEAQEVDLGLNPKGVLAMTLDVDLLQREEEEGRRFAVELARRLGELPGARGVALASPVPMDYMVSVDTVRVAEDVLAGGADTLQVFSSRVGVEYFATVETPIVAGRTFEETDGPDGEPVIIVNETLAERLWPGRSALGQTLGLVGEEGPLRRVVGVARDGKYRLLGEGPTSFLYLPWQQAYTSRMTFLVRADGDPRALVEMARQTVQELEPDLALLDVRDLPSLIEGRALSPIQLAAALAGSFGLLGLVLASAGLYGVMAYNVAQRTREMGIRVAVGARAGELVGLVVLQGLRLSALGLGIGVVLTVLSSRVLETFLVGVSPGDPAILGAVAAVLVVVAVFATLAPAVRAARVDPVVSLRNE